jgi:acetoacetyl-CoA synthetase
LAVVPGSVLAMLAGPGWCIIFIVIPTEARRAERRELVEATLGNGKIPPLDALGRDDTMEQGSKVTTDKPIWVPSKDRIAGSMLTKFLTFLRAERGVDCADYEALWRWSIAEPEAFWVALWDWAEVIGERGDRVLINGDQMPGAEFFPDARVNYAEHLLRHATEGGADKLAIWFRNETGADRKMTWAELYDATSRVAAALRADGVGPGSRVAAYMSSLPETFVVALAAAAVGAAFCSCSPDFGVKGALDRLGQVEPDILFAADGYLYNGKTHSALDKLPEVVAGLPSVKRTVLVPYIDPSATPPAGLSNATTLAEYSAPHPAGEIAFERVPFSAPLFILFSSGTTGVPKCIVHRTGGVLIQHLKEELLTDDVRPDDRVFFFTSTNWMVWNVHISYLACRAALLVYDGSPFYPDRGVLWRFAADAGATHFGTSAKYIDALRQHGDTPGKDNDLSALRMIVTSGSALVAEAFDYAYANIKEDLHLGPVSGGTDTASSFVGPNPNGPVWRGEMQARTLAMQVEVWGDDGKPLPHGEQGELVCVNPFPSMPVGFLNDPGDERYKAAYFEHFPGVWRHGDLMALYDHEGPSGKATDRTVGAVIFGRSDATLNPGGVRIGTAEIYRQVEQVEEVEEGLAIGQDWPPEAPTDTRIVLFVKLHAGQTLDDALRDKIKQQIRANTTPRHVPAVILQVPDIPRTKTGKIVELAVRDVVHGRPVKNLDALANPEALDAYAGLQALKG